MLYSILIYGSEALVESFSEEQEQMVLAKHYAVQDRLRARGTLGPFARLMPTTAAVTLRTRKDETVVVDGPFAETKEQLLGLYLVECESLEEAVEAARGLPVDVGALEVRPVHYYQLGVLRAPPQDPQAGSGPPGTK